MSREQRKGLLKESSKKEYIWLTISSIGVAVVAIGINIWKGAAQVGYSVVDVCALLIAFVSSFVSIHLTLEINRLAEQNRREEEKKIDRENYYARVHTQAASFPKFKIDTCIVYDLDKLLTKDDVESRTICDYVRKHEPVAQKKYLLEIGSKEAFPAYYKVDIKAVNLMLQTEKGSFQIELPAEHCWVTNNEQFSFWINFDDQNGLIEELWEVVDTWIPGEKVYLEICVEFACANILLERGKETSLYRINLDCFAQNRPHGTQVELKVEHRYLSRVNTEE